MLLWEEGDISFVWWMKSKQEIAPHYSSTFGLEFSVTQNAIYSFHCVSFRILKVQMNRYFTKGIIKIRGLNELITFRSPTAQSQAAISLSLWYLLIWSNRSSDEINITGGLNKQKSWFHCSGTNTKRVTFKQHRPSSCGTVVALSFIITVTPQPIHVSWVCCKGQLEKVSQVARADVRLFSISTCQSEYLLGWCSFYVLCLK